MSPRDERGARDAPVRQWPGLQQLPRRSELRSLRVMSVCHYPSGLPSCRPMRQLRRKPVVARNCSRRSPILWLVPARGGYAEHETPSFGGSPPHEGPLQRRRALPARVLEWRWEANKQVRRLIDENWALWPRHACEYNPLHRMRGPLRPGRWRSFLGSSRG
jgi:hypothetical protein